jgi:hypothetical protein
MIMQKAPRKKTPMCARDLATATRLGSTLGYRGFLQSQASEVAG